MALHTANPNQRVTMKPSLFITCLLAASIPTLAFADRDTDHNAEKTAKNSYNLHVVLQDHVKVDVDNGIATLTGTVEDKDQKDLAEDTVSNLPGVDRVDNRITLANGQPEHSDGWIALKIRSKLLVRAHVSATKTHVDVLNGAVTLTGTAETSAQKELTGEYAKEVEGVRSVKNEIVIVRPSGEAPTMSDKIDDASITASVKFALLGNSGTSALKTKVITEEGVVSLSGTADNSAEKDLASRLAERVRGVRSVTNNMTVKE